MSVKLQSNPDVLIADLIELARTYGWNGDYVEVEAFVRWSIDEIGEKYDNEKYFELVPYEDD